MSMILKVTHAVGVCRSGRSTRLAQFKLFERDQNARTSFVLELMTPIADPLLTL